jgi:hypothetical protein
VHQVTHGAGEQALSAQPEHVLQPRTREDELAHWRKDAHTFGGRHDHRLETTDQVKEIAAPAGAHLMTVVRGGSPRRQSKTTLSDIAVAGCARCQVK